MEAYYDAQALQSNNIDYSGLHTAVPTSLPLPLSCQKTENIGGIEGNNLLSTSILMANGIAGTISNDELPLNNTWTTSSAHAYPGAYQQQLLTTSPPEGNTFLPTYPLQPWQTYGFASNQVVSASCMTQPITTGTPSFVRNPYVLGSSLEDSPISSPSSCDGTHSPHESEEVAYLQNQAPITTTATLHSSHCNSVYTTAGYEYMMAPTYAQGIVHLESQEQYDMGLQVPKGVKMPQRKGGIQLWQFLYSLLTSTESKDREIVEWTSNMHEREFRMLEPECIAVWWGHHKNKPNMSYDKFSRSLRYYYDKGILKKIPGERYVYRFLIDPEHMYRHIGTSDCRPKLKPMPQAAKLAMSKYQQNSSIDFKNNSRPIITQDPEPLEKNCASESSSIKTAEWSESTGPGSTMSTIIDSKSSDSLLPINTVNSSSTGKLHKLGQGSSTRSLSMKRSRSLEYASSNCCERSPKQMALSMDSASCPPTLCNSYESFPTDFRSYSYPQCQDISVTSQSCSTSEPLYAKTMNDITQVNMPHQLYYSQPKFQTICY